MVTKKYLLTDETLEIDGRVLKRIQAARDFGCIKKWEKGGWIENEDNLSQEGLCWVWDEAKVWGRARITGDAQIWGNACIHGNAQISGNANVYGNTEIWGSAKISENAEVFDTAYIDEDAEIFGTARIGGSAWVSRSMKVQNGLLT